MQQMQHTIRQAKINELNTPYKGVIFYGFDIPKILRIGVQKWVFGHNLHPICAPINKNRLIIK